MSKKMLMLLLCFIGANMTFSQPPTDGYDYDCFAAMPYDTTGTATAFYNDPDGDCISNDWIVIFEDSEGGLHIYTDEDWEASDPSSGGWYNFGNEFWDCCTDEIGGNSTDGDEGCPCSWNFDEELSILTIDCPCE